MIKSIIVIFAIGLAVNAIPAQNQKDLISTAVNLLGLGNVWSTIQELGSSTVAQVTAILTQLLFAGQQIWDQAKVVFAQLVSDLTSHAGDALPLVAQAITQLNGLISSGGKRDLISTAVNLLGLGNVWSTIQELGSSTVAQVTAILTQLLFAGQQIWDQAKVVFAQLVSDLTSHAGDALPLVAQAISQLNGLISQGK